MDDITERMRVAQERQVLRERLYRAEKMEALGDPGRRGRPRPQQRAGRLGGVFGVAVGEDPAGQSHEKICCQHPEIR